MKGKTIRGLGGDRLRAVRDVDPLDGPLGHEAQDFVFVTATERSGGPASDETQVCVMLTPKQARAFADVLRALARGRRIPRGRRRPR